MEFSSHLQHILGIKKKYAFTIVVWTEGETGTVRLKNEAYFSKHLELLCVPPHLQEHCSCVCCLPYQGSCKALYLHLCHTLQKLPLEPRKTEFEKQKNKLEPCKEANSDLPEISQSRRSQCCQS